MQISNELKELFEAHPDLLENKEWDQSLFDELTDDQKVLYLRDALDRARASGLVPRSMMLMEKDGDLLFDKMSHHTLNGQKIVLLTGETFDDVMYKPVGSRAAADAGLMGKIKVAAAAQPFGKYTYPIYIVSALILLLGAIALGSIMGDDSDLSESVKPKSTHVVKKNKNKKSSEKETKDKVEDKKAVKESSSSSSDKKSEDKDEKSVVKKEEPKDKVSAKEDEPKKSDNKSSSDVSVKSSSSTDSAPPSKAPSVPKASTGPSKVVPVIPTTPLPSVTPSKPSASKPSSSKPSSSTSSSSSSTKTESSSTDDSSSTEASSDDSGSVDEVIEDNSVPGL